MTVTTGGHGRSPLVVLRARGTTRALPLAVGEWEADAIWAKLTENLPDRPQAHDLMKALLDAGRLRVRKAAITGVNGDVYCATLFLDADGRERQVDCRPSDAIALALRCGAPIVVAKALMDSKDVIDLTAHRGPMQVGGLTIQELTPALAARLGLAGGHGVVIADVRAGRFAGTLERRDVLLEAAGGPVTDVYDAALKLDRLNPDRAERVVILRAGKRVELTVPPAPADDADDGNSGDEDQNDQGGGGSPDEVNPDQ